MPCTDLLHGIPTQAHGDEVRLILAERFSKSSRASITSALVHWDRVCDEWNWPRFILTGDPCRGAKLVCFVLALMSHEREPDVFYPSSTITNYVWALCAFMQENLHADPRVNVIGWRIFMASVAVMCFVPYEPRRRLPTSVIRSALAAVDTSDFAMVQMAVFVLFLWFTFQRSEFPCPKTYGGLDPAKHLYVRHMEPHHGGFRWAVGTTKADPRAERLSADAGPGREWIVVGEVNDSLFDLRIWIFHLLSFYPEGPRDPDTPFFRNTRDLTRPYIYREALPDFRTFITGHVDDPSLYGLHANRSEGFVVCSNSVGEEAAVIQGGWRGLVTASRYDRLTNEVTSTMAQKMVDYTNPSPQSQGEVASSSGDPSSSGTLGIVARRAAARTLGASKRRPAARAAAPAAASVPTPSRRRSQASLPAGWRRFWHSTSARGGYAYFVGPCGRRARSIAQAVAMAAEPGRSASVITVENLVDHVTEFDRPPTRRPPTVRVPV